MDKDYLLKKWLENDLTSEEQIAFDALEDSPFFKEIIQEGARFKNQNPNKVMSFETFEKEIQTKKKSRINWLKIVTRVAAVFVIGIGLYFLTSKDEYQSFETQVAQTEQITLPDNSKVTLNELSSLDFNSKNWDKQRSLNLKGEAFFKVAKGKRFDVNTGFGTVSVLGTQFNVSTRDSIFAVTCYEGLVQVSHNDKTIKLPAGKAYRIVNGVPEAFNIAVIQPEWLQQMKIFKNAPVGVVFTALENHYNITIVADNVDRSMLFTGAFELNNLDNALKATTESLELTYEIKNTKVAVVKNAEQ